ncbi:hypothetical protein Tco_1363417 [Tanacetum coccineum]
MAQVHLLQSQKDKLEQQKAKAKAEVDFLKAWPSYPDINYLTELLVTSLKPELSKLLASHDFANYLPTELNKLPSKITKLSKDVKELKKHTLDALPSLLHKVTDTLNKFATIVENASSKAIDNGVPSAGHANASPVEGEKNTNQDTKDDDNSKGKEVMSSKDTEDEETKSDFEDDHANPAEIMTKSSEKKKLKKFSFVTEGSEQIYLTTEKIKEQKRIEESLNAELAKQEVEKLKSELVDLMGIDVVTQYYNKRLMYIKYYDKVLKRRKNSKITNCYVLTTKGPITLKVYREDGTNEVISNLKVIDLHLAEWRKVVQACPNRKENRMEDHLWADKDKNGIP